MLIASDIVFLCFYVLVFFSSLVFSAKFVSLYLLGNFLLVSVDGEMNIFIP